MTPEEAPIIVARERAAVERRKRFLADCLERHAPGETAESLARRIPDGTDTGEGLPLDPDRMTAAAYDAIFLAVDSVRSPRQRGESLSPGDLEDIRSGYLAAALELAARYPPRSEELHGMDPADVFERGSCWGADVARAYPNPADIPFAEDPDDLWSDVGVADFDSASLARVDSIIRDWFARMADVRGFTLRDMGSSELESIGTALFLSANGYTSGFSESRYDWSLWDAAADKVSGSEETYLEFNTTSGKVTL